MGRKMQRVMVMGPPGSGKSTLAGALGARFSIPVFHLDQAYWRSGWERAPAAVFAAEVERIAALPAWVIDGNYSMSIDARLAAADTLIFLDVPRWLCMARILRRIAGSYGRVRPDAAAGCPERLDWAFLRFAWDWHGARRADGLACAAAFPHRKLIIKDARQALAFATPAPSTPTHPATSAPPRSRRS